MIKIPYTHFIDRYRDFLYLKCLVCVFITAKLLATMIFHDEEMNI